MSDIELPLRHLATVNLWRNPDMSLSVTFAEANGVKEELGESGAPVHLCAMNALRAAVASEAAETILSLRALLGEAHGYVEANHDEGCELDPEYGRMNFEMKHEDNEGRIWPDEAKCDCGTDELAARIAAALATEAE